MRVCGQPDFDQGDALHMSGPRVNILLMMRIRNCLMGCVRHRMQKIEEFRWEVAGTMPEENEAMLDAHERQYARDYNQLLSDYQIKYDLDLTRDGGPPGDLLIKVNVLEGIGRFVGPESGATLELRRGDRPALRRGDVEHLVRQGILQHQV